MDIARFARDVFGIDTLPVLDFWVCLTLCRLADGFCHFGDLPFDLGIYLIPIFDAEQVIRWFLDKSSKR